jgi:hypothetical protein
LAVSMPLPSDFTRALTWGSITRLTVTSTFIGSPAGMIWSSQSEGTSFYRMAAAP